MKLTVDDPLKSTHILGIDPGLSGAICFYEIATRRIQVFDMPVVNGRVDAAPLAQIVDQCSFQAGRRVHAAIEQVSSMPRQKGSFNFGVSAGIIQGVLGALGIPFTMVQPALWKGAVGLRKTVGETQAENKTRARELASKLWPEMAGEFKRVKDDGRAESALIARFAASKAGL